MKIKLLESFLNFLLVQNLHFLPCYLKNSLTDFNLVGHTRVSICRLSDYISGSKSQRLRSHEAKYRFWKPGGGVILDPLGQVGFDPLGSSRYLLSTPFCQVGFLV